MKKNTVKTLLMSATLAATLSACTPFIVASNGATGVAGGMAVMDRRTFGTQTEDRVIGYKAESMADAIVGNSGHVNATSFNRRVLLTGEVPSENYKARIEAEVKQIEHVREIINEIAIMEPSSLMTRSNDTMITGKVSATIFDTEGLSSSAFKTVTERGIVYLMGRVTEREGDRAAHVVSYVPDVVKVVKVFEYITEEELEALNTVRASSSTPPSTEPVD